MINRRSFGKILGGAGVAMASSWPALSLAKIPTDSRLVVIIQRGAQDGLHAVPPHGEDEYFAMRPRIAVPRPGAEGGAFDLDGRFGLHPALKGLHDLYTQEELTVVPAVATRYRERSHFDAQNLLENGTSRPFGADDGWLNRALAGYKDQSQKLGFAFGFTVPLLLRGALPVNVYAPSTLPEVDDDFLRRLYATYEDDAVFEPALAESLNPMVMTEDMSNRDTRRAARGQSLVFAARAAADALAPEDGARVAVLESNGWDTHNNQNGRLNALFADMDEAITTLKTGLGDAWKKTAIVTVSEFGRTAAENGSGGTDHGTGGVSFLAGGAVAGGKIAGAWPGLKTQDLFEGRDVAPRNPLEGILKALLIDHLGLAPQYVDSTVFPGSGDLWPMMNLFRG